MAQTARKMLPDRWCILCILSLVTGVILLPIGTDGFTFDFFQRKNNSQINATTASSIESTTNRLNKVQASINVLPLPQKRILDRPAVSSTSPSPDVDTAVLLIVPDLSNKPEESSYPPVSQMHKSTVIHHVPFKRLGNGYITQIDIESEPPEVFQSGGSNMESDPSTFLGTSQNTLIYPQNSWNNYASYSYQPTPWDVRSIFKYPMYSVQPVPWVNSYNSRYSPSVTTKMNSVAWNGNRRQGLPEYNGRYTPFYLHSYNPQSHPPQYIYPFESLASDTNKDQFDDFEYIPYAKIGKDSESVQTEDIKSTTKNVNVSKPDKEHPQIEGKGKIDKDMKPKSKIHALVSQTTPESEIRKDIPEKGEGAEISMTRYQPQYPFPINNHHIRHGNHNPFHHHQYYSTY